MRYKSLSASLAMIVGTMLLPHGARADPQDAATLYSDNCAGCHGQSGKGDGPAVAGLNPKPADLSKVLEGKPDAWIAKVIRGGGPAVGKSPIMPAFDGAFSADQMQGLIAYLREFATKK
ncbi:MAG TPA: cytochrome c, partial [Candidatus Binataceae bacterium]|nr:cytochrome c [Candidatus Binataceae bacterium]